MHEPSPMRMFMTCARYFVRAFFIGVVASIPVAYAISFAPKGTEYATNLTCIAWLLGIPALMKVKSHFFKLAVGILVWTIALSSAYLWPSLHWGMAFSWTMVALIPLAWATHDVASDMLQAERVRPFKRR